LRDVNPFGFILFARHIQTPDQIRALCAEFRTAVGRECLITIDQEGGHVQRLRPPLARDLPPALSYVQGCAEPMRAMYVRARVIAHELHALGIDSNCIPNLDLVFPDTHPFLRDRCYGADPDAVGALGQAVADGLSDGGVVPVTKHLPGHGRAMQDSHFDLPVVAVPLDTLRQTDFRPFQHMRSAPLAMTAHVIYSAIDDLPATLSPKVMDLIRDELQVTSLIMTDDISMKALSGELDDLTRASLAAGCDLVLHCNDTLTERRLVAEAAGEMTDAAQARAEAAMAWRKDPDDVDIAALQRELDAFHGEAGHG
jgi:beta-N-acetylhexosaminidase